jgi:outer membrane protein assembly factor BamB
MPADITHIQPRQIWKSDISSGFGGVTVSEGRVYVMDRQTKPEEQERVLCFDLESGKLNWEHHYLVSYGKMDYGTGPRASVTIDEGRAFTLGATGMAFCLDAASGRVIWQCDTVKELGAVVPTWGFAASPFLWKGNVLLHVGAKPMGSVIALDQASGKEKWRGGDDPAGYCTPMVIEHAGSSQLIQWGPEHITSLSPDDGKKFWSIPYKITYGVSIAQPIFHEGMVFVSGYWHGARAIKLGDQPQAAEVAWSEERTLCGLMSQPLYRNGIVYMLSKGDGIVAFQLKDGKQLWSDHHLITPKDRNPQASLVWADRKNGIMCALNAVGELVFVRVNAEKVEELCRHQIIGKTWAHPAYTRNMIIARNDKELVAWKLWE